MSSASMKSMKSKKNKLTLCGDAEIPCDANLGCDYITVVKFSPDGRHLAVGDENDVVRIFSVEGGPTAAPVLLQTLAPPSEDYILSLAWSPDGQYLAVGDDLFYLTVYRRDDPNWGSATLLVHETPLPGCSQWVTPTATRTEISSTSDAGCFRLHSLQFSPDGEMLAVGAGGKDSRCKGLPDDAAVCTESKNVVFVYAVSSWMVVHTLNPSASDDYVTGVAWSPDGAVLVAVDDDNALTVWQTSTWAQSASVAACSGNCENVAFAPNGAYVAIGGGHGHFTVHRTSDWQQTADIQVTNYDWMSGGGVKGIDISPDSRTVLVGSDTGRPDYACLSEATCSTGGEYSDGGTYSMVAEFEVSAGGVPQGWRSKIEGADRDYNTVAYHPGGSYFAAGNDNGVVYLFCSGQ
ncbi:hypothetical protein TrVE_jg4600 [Triparma verrucosa]|uniref:Uncharacterized protein n=1 Tax=Triparma verrucosa TaxID=1606542 RepID=A0A9W7F507_9STRA|nr:hypothetical protein TrVE_jg4600 [Triparma verrucosa]